MGHPLASGFHFGTKDVAWADGEQSEAIAASEAARATIDSPSPGVQTCPGTGLPLPSPTPNNRFTQVLLERRTWRGFGKTPVPLSSGTLLWLTFGVQMGGAQCCGRARRVQDLAIGWRSPSDSKPMCSPSASAGCQEACITSDRIHAGCISSAVARQLRSSWKHLRAVVVCRRRRARSDDCRPSAVCWRYPHPRAYRSVLLGAGHLCQTFCLVATSLKLDLSARKHWPTPGSSATWGLTASTKLSFTPPASAAGPGTADGSNGRDTASDAPFFRRIPLGRHP